MSSGSLSSLSLIPIIEPEMGIYKSASVLRASIVPKISFWLKISFKFGNSIKTISPNSPCAKSVMPTYATSPSTFNHSCSF